MAGKSSRIGPLIQIIIALPGHYQVERGDFLHYKWGYPKLAGWFISWEILELDNSSAFS
jgi:hypothetical protein